MQGRSRRWLRAGKPARRHGLARPGGGGGDQVAPRHGVIGPLPQRFLRVKGRKAQATSTHNPTVSHASCQERPPFAAFVEGVGAAGERECPPGPTSRLRFRVMFRLFYSIAPGPSTTKALGLRRQGTPAFGVILGIDFERLNA